MSVDELISGAVATGAVPGIVAIVCDADGVIREAAAGTTGPGDDRPVGPDTVFRIASMTKAMTSVAALGLVERGDLRLDQPVADAIPTARAVSPRRS